MTHYIVGHIAVRDRERYALYEAGFMPILQRFGGRLLAVSDAPEVLEGDADNRRLVILAFDDRDAAIAWIRSPEYQALAKHRHAASEAFIQMTGGLD